MIECHGAGTPVGDRAELESLRRLWGDAGWRPAQCAIGSVKSMIGHLLTAAGAAGLIKTLLAMNHGVLPPTLHFRQAPAESPLNGGPFRVQTECQAWERRGPDLPRRAAVSAFGFGGINAHLLIEEWMPDGGRLKVEAGSKKGVQLPLLDSQREPPPRICSSSAGIPPPALRLPPCAVAIVGMAACFGQASGLVEFWDALRTGRSLVEKRPDGRWKGCEAALPGLEDLTGCFLEEIVLERGEFHIPPVEIPDILPQHLLMLKMAASAMADAGLPLRAERPRMGALIGIDFDFESTNFHLRWYLEGVFPRWRRTHWADLSDAQAMGWLEALKDAWGPPLTANRTLGALGSMVASRIAREFRFGGPSFVVSGAEASGLRALQIGVRALQAAELDAVLIGAVDLCGDPRCVAARRDLRAPAAPAEVIPPGEGAAALVLKRLADAQAQGDRVYAVVRGIGAASGGGVDGGLPSADACLRSLAQAATEAGFATSSAEWLATQKAFASHDPSAGRAVADWSLQNGIQPVLGSTADALGASGAVQGLAAVVTSSLCLHQQIIPPPAAERPEGEPGNSPGTREPLRPQAGPPESGGLHRAMAGALTDDGNCMHVALESQSETHAKMSLETVAQRPQAGGRLSSLEASDRERKRVRIPVAGRALIFPPPPIPTPPGPDRRTTPADEPHAADEETAADLLRRLSAVSEATAGAHRRFLEKSTEMTRAYAEAFELQRRLLAYAGRRKGDAAPAPAAIRPPAFDRELCLEFARGSAARVLGPRFAEVDAFPARVRLPDEPLMLVDRILEIQGEKGSLGPGRIITEHEVRPGAWYLDGGRAPVCISVEAGQADLFLCAYLGIDLVVRGRRTYRLLDATVRFHRDLPRPGETIRYAIDIEKFIRQGETYLFLFRFEGTIGGRPLITMTNGCAGFFTPEEVAGSGGIILTDEEKQPQAGRKPLDWPAPVALAVESYDEAALEELRAGNPAACFGSRFAGVRIPEAQRLPGGRMRLIDRVLGLEPQGGRYGLGRIRAEADIHADDWFLTCHFVDDRVMPGTLMYECCAHTLRVMLQRMGWILERPDVRYEPVPEVAATLKCRGPVTPATRRVVYEVDLKELGHRPQPFAVADADMYADGHHIVRFSEMSLQLTGATRSQIEAFWKKRPVASPGAAARVSFSRERLEQFATGRPSAAFGERYAVFDSERFIARLPAPPFLCMDRVTAVEPPPWVVQPGGWVEAEFDVRPEAWYVAAERTGDVPYSILLETALQPCGWLAAYMGSALKSENALHFRNLGGRGTLHRTVAADAGTLRVRTRLSQVSEVADMIIEHFDFEIHGPAGLVYDGSTYFGFFTRNALQRQEGIRDIGPPFLSAAADATGETHMFEFTAEKPLHPRDPGRTRVSGLMYPAKALSMIDRIERFLPQGGPRSLGFVRGSKEVDPAEWFFKAHFYQDPVCPGSLGIESFLQLVKFAARQRWPHLTGTHRFGLHTGRSHRWTYRGQILPANRRVTVEASITEVIESPQPSLIAEGFLMVDGLPIYRMEEFGIQLIPVSPEVHG
jgi:3-hydroxymyristoyl/3-hydroxydecanoyl-(acyl carrier protein) dehydratase/3-oxoacyl-(acyl-carrier-protein) synthase